MKTPTDREGGLDAREDAARIVTQLTQERDEAREERDALRAEMSEAFGLPPTIGPTKGEAKRIVDWLRTQVAEGAAAREEAERLHNEVRLVVAQRDAAERGEAAALARLRAMVGLT